jgi:3-dehydroquinate dehydratase-1
MNFGEGLPKICIPITGKTSDDILKEAQMAVKDGADLIEWRADAFANVTDTDKCLLVAGKIRSEFPDLPILFTYRTEDGAHTMETSKYIELNKTIANSSDVDLIDIELSKGDDICKELCEYIHSKNKLVVLSSHNFEHTPQTSDITSTLRHMKELGGDVPKLAVMPKTSLDVINILEGSIIYKEKYANGPFITMSMGDLGRLSRVSGELTGSALTFGVTENASAPGQIPISELRNILQTLHFSH